MFDDGKSIPEGEPGAHDHGVDRPAHANGPRTQSLAQQAQEPVACSGWEFT